MKRKVRVYGGVQRPEIGNEKRWENGRSLMSTRLDEIADWKPKASGGLKSDDNEYGFPTVIYRTPSRLVEECEEAFDVGLLLAALSLVVTIPDVCANIAGVKYLDWCKEYLDLPNSGEKIAAARKERKTEEEIAKAFDAITARGIFSASDLYQLRCAVVHAGSSVVMGKGEDYSPYKAIGVCVQGDARGIIASYGHKGIGYGSQQDCAFECVVKLEGLISLIATGVCKFVEEDPERDREYSTGKELSRQGVVDFRSINKKQSF